MTMPESCAIIAGAGSFPFHVAAHARRSGARVIALGIEGWVDAALASHVDAYEEIAIGQLGRLIERLKAHQVRQVVMAGKVTKGVLLDPRVRFDAEAIQALGRAGSASVNAVLGAVAVRLAQEGITLLASSTFLQRELCPAGVLTRRRPTPEEEASILVGVGIARHMAALDVGQSLAVKGRVVVAVEALEGTDAMLQRAGQVAGYGCVLVKTASPTQDRRFDLPVIGLTTLEVAAQAGVTCLALEAGSTLLLDKDALIQKADAAGLSIIGVEPPAAPA
jgi:DUF1009 family protein